MHKHEIDGDGDSSSNKLIIDEFDNRLTFVSFVYWGKPLSWSDSSFVQICHPSVDLIGLNITFGDFHIYKWHWHLISSATNRLIEETNLITNISLRCNFTSVVVQFSVAIGANFPENVGNAYLLFILSLLLDSWLTAWFPAYISYHWPTTLSRLHSQWSEISWL